MIYFFHIGGYKTGSTSIQSHFRRNKQHYLKEHGLLYPRSLLRQGAPGHVEFVAALGNETPSARKRPKARPFLRQLELLQTELAEKHPDKVLISSETFLPSMDPVTEFVDPGLLSRMPGMSEAKIVYYVRHPRSAAVSKFKQVIKSPFWRYQGDFDSFCDQWIPCGNPLSLIGPWAETFGCESLILRPFRLPDTDGTGILEDFGEVLGTGITGELHEGNRNSAPSFYAIEALRQMRIAGSEPKSHQDVIAFLQKTDTDTPKDIILEFDAEYLERISGTLDRLDEALRPDLERFVHTYELPTDFFDM